MIQRGEPHFGGIAPSSLAYGMQDFLHHNSWADQGGAGGGSWGGNDAGYSYFVGNTSFEALRASLFSASRAHGGRVGGSGGAEDRTVQQLFEFNPNHVYIYDEEGLNIYNPEISSTGEETLWHVRTIFFGLTVMPKQAIGGGDPSGWSTANTVVGATGVVPSTIEMGTVLIKQSANYTDDIARVAKISSKTGKALGYVGVGLTIADGVANGWKNHHTADVIIGGAQTLLLGAGPVGWGIGLVWLTADIITTGVTGKSITENLFD